jgi:hypothetical protein
MRLSKNYYYEQDCLNNRMTTKIVNQAGFGGVSIIPAAQ